MESGATTFDESESAVEEDSAIGAARANDEDVSELALVLAEFESLLVLPSDSEVLEDSAGIDALRFFEAFAAASRARKAAAFFAACACFCFIAAVAFPSNYPSCCSLHCPSHYSLRYFLRQAFRKTVFHQPCLLHLSAQFSFQS